MLGTRVPTFARFVKNLDPFTNDFIFSSACSLFGFFAPQSRGPVDPALRSRDQLIMDNYSAISSALPSFDSSFGYSSFEPLTGRSRVTYFCMVSALLYATYYFLTRKHGKIDVPYYRASLIRWIFDAEGGIKDSYTQYQDSVYQIKATEGFQTIVPARLVGELKGLPDDVFSQPEAIGEVRISVRRSLSAQWWLDLQEAILTT